MELEEYVNDLSFPSFYYRYDIKLVSERNQCPCHAHALEIKKDILVLASLLQKIRLSYKKALLSTSKLCRSHRSVCYDKIDEYARKLEDVMMKLSQFPTFGNKVTLRNVSIPEHFHRRATFLDSKNCIHSNWDGSDFKISLLLSLRKKLQLKIIFEALRQNCTANISCRHYISTLQRRKSVLFLQFYFHSLKLNAYIERYFHLVSMLKIQKYQLQSWIAPRFSYWHKYFQYKKGCKKIQNSVLKEYSKRCRSRVLKLFYLRVVHRRLYNTIQRWIVQRNRMYRLCFGFLSWMALFVSRNSEKLSLISRLRNHSISRLSHSDESPVEGEVNQRPCISRDMIEDVCRDHHREIDQHMIESIEEIFQNSLSIRTIFPLLWGNRWKTPSTSFNSAFRHCWPSLFQEICATMIKRKNRDTTTTTAAKDSHNLDIGLTSGGKNNVHNERNFINEEHQMETCSYSHIRIALHDNNSPQHECRSLFQDAYFGRNLFRHPDFEFSVRDSLLLDCPNREHWSVTQKRIETNADEEGHNWASKTATVPSYRSSNQLDDENLVFVSRAFRIIDKYPFHRDSRTPYLQVVRLIEITKGLLNQWKLFIKQRKGIRRLEVRRRNRYLKIVWRMWFHHLKKWLIEKEVLHETACVKCLKRHFIAWKWRSVNRFRRPYRSVDRYISSCLVERYFGHWRKLRNELMYDYKVEAIVISNRKKLRLKLMKSTWKSWISWTRNEKKVSLQLRKYDNKLRRGCWSVWHDMVKKRVLLKRVFSICELSWLLRYQECFETPRLLRLHRIVEVWKSFRRHKKLEKDQCIQVTSALYFRGFQLLWRVWEAWRRFTAEARHNRQQHHMHIRFLFRSSFFHICDYARDSKSIWTDFRISRFNFLELKNHWRHWKQQHLEDSIHRPGQHFSKVLLRTILTHWKLFYRLQLVGRFIAAHREKYAVVVNNRLLCSNFFRWKTRFLGRMRFRIGLKRLNDFYWTFRLKQMFLLWPGRLQIQRSEAFRRGRLLNPNKKVKFIDAHVIEEKICKNKPLSKSQSLDESCMLGSVSMNRMESNRSLSCYSNDRSSSSSSSSSNVFPSRNGNNYTYQDAKMRGSVPSVASRNKPSPPAKSFIEVNNYPLLAPLPHRHSSPSNPPTNFLESSLLQRALHLGIFSQPLDPNTVMAFFRWIQNIFHEWYRVRRRWQQYRIFERLVAVRHVRYLMLGSIRKWISKTPRTQHRRNIWIKDRLIG